MMAEQEQQPEQPSTGAQPPGPFNLESYNSWRYGDEASLYSIAEDSREDRQSEAVFSRASGRAETMSTVSGGGDDNRDSRGGNHGGGHTAAVISNSNGVMFALSGIHHSWRPRRSENGVNLADDSDSSDDSVDHHDHDDVSPVEIKWVSDDEEMDNRSPSSGASTPRASGNNGRRGGGSPKASMAAASSTTTTKAGVLLRRVPSSASSEDSYSQMLGYRLNPSRRRPHRLVIAACFVCLVMAVIILAVVLTPPDDDDGDNGDGTKTSPGSVGSDGGDGDGADSSWDDIDPPTPSPATSQPPPANYSDIVAEAAQEFAYESISACPYADSDEFFDLSAPQAEVFRELIMELEHAAKVESAAAAANSTGNGSGGGDDVSVDFESTHGMGYLLERWALLMLFFSTNGEYWERNDGWYTDTDVCEWEAALRICEPRVQGEAAMTYLDLRK
jgi:hypothetical protein